MSNEFDGFSDILDSDHHTGIFGSSEPALDNAFQEHLKVATTPIADGLALEFACEGCKKKLRLTLDWPEVVALRNGLNPKQAYAPNVPLIVRTPQGPRQNGSASQICRNPTDWSFRQKEGAWGLNQQCSCSWHYQVRMTPREIEALLRRAQQSHYLGPAPDGRPSSAQAADFHCKAFLAAAQQRR